jgi:flagella basal body P-ring formation protein FlgA
MMNNGRPLSMRKKVQIMVAMTILAWATQTLFHQWARGAEVAPVGQSRADESTARFVPRDASTTLVAGGTLELRAEARVHGGVVKLKQVCRWSDADAAVFAPVAELIVVKLETRRPFKTIAIKDVRQTLEAAGINVAVVRFSGPLECTVSRNDAELSEGEALEQWMKSREGKPVEVQPQDVSAKPQAADPVRKDDSPVRNLRSILVADLSVRLTIPQDQLVLTFDPRDEGALNLAEPQFKFSIQPRKVRDLGDVAWDVVLLSQNGGGSRKLQIRGTARAWQDQLIVARPMSRRQVVQETDITNRRLLVDQLPEGALLAREQVVGQMASRDLKPGSVMTASTVEAVPLAKANQYITVTLERGGIRIKGVAKALEGGCYGQMIRVKNEATKDVYQVVLTGPQEGSIAPPPPTTPLPPPTTTVEPAAPAAPLPEAKIVAAARN